VSHVWRPLFVALALVAGILIFRAFYVPKEFGIGESGYMYGWHNPTNEQYWKDIKVKYQGSKYCKDCHSKNFTYIQNTPHAIIPCENCHGPGTDHPGKIAKLPIDINRLLCLRCHAILKYPNSDRGKIRGIDPATHQDPNVECVTCHDPHNPNLGALKKSSQRFPSYKSEPGAPAETGAEKAKK
jgi:Cytochrome c3